MLLAPPGGIAQIGAEWQFATPATHCPLPSDLPHGLEWLAATVPGTVASNLSTHGLYDVDRPQSLHHQEFWYRVRLDATGDRLLRLRGLAGIADVFFDDRLVVSSRNMFVAHEVAVALEPGTMLFLRFRSLAVELARPSPRPRWRTRLTPAQGLRSVRMTMLGHMPGWCPPIDAIGPYRAIELADRAGPVWRVALRTRLADGVGIATVTLGALGRACDGSVSLEVADRSIPIGLGDAGSSTIEVSLPGIAPWWPHTHGKPELHDAHLSTSSGRLPLGRLGFRHVAIDREGDGAGFGVRINDVPVFCRGACWTSASLLDLAHGPDAYRSILGRARDAGMNMIRVGGTMLYEDDAFHAACDELGLMVWQDLMFASLDPACEEDPMRASVFEETDQLCARLSRHPSSTVLCGGSEVAQQAAMFGLPATARTLDFFELTLADRVASALPEIAYVANSPSGGDPPFRVDRGIGHYYSVGAYRRPLTEQRRDGVRFAAECLAFANVPDETTRRTHLAEVPPQDPRWKALVPRDPGVSWDFEDVRDHYLADVYRIDPPALRRIDPERYLDLSRGVVADLMERVLSEWRRPGSSCRGALVWQLQDVAHGSGWGVIDADGRPKSAWHGMRRALGARQLLISDEGPNGLVVHALNETAEAIDVRIELRCLRNGRDTVMSGERAVSLAARSAVSLSATELFGRFFDANLAYGFGPPSHDVVIATLHAADGSGLVSETSWFAGAQLLPTRDLGMSATLVPASGLDESWTLDVSTDRFAQSVYIDADGFEADRNWFHLPPGRPVKVHLRCAARGAGSPCGEIGALNALSRVGFG